MLSFLVHNLEVPSVFSLLLSLYSSNLSTTPPQGTTLLPTEQGSVVQLRDVTITDTNPATVFTGMAATKCGSEALWLVTVPLTNQNKSYWLSFASEEYTIVQSLQTADELPSCIKDGSGLNYFKAAINNWNENLQYKICIALLVNNNPNAPLFCWNDLKEQIEIVSTAFYEGNCPIYSPMGISRTTTAAQRLEKQRRDNQVVQRDNNMPMSIVFHSYLYHIMKHLNPKIEAVVTTPVAAMRYIFLKYLNSGAIYSLKKEALEEAEIKFDRFRLAGKYREIQPPKTVHVLTPDQFQQRFPFVQAPWSKRSKDGTYVFFGNSEFGSHGPGFIAIPGEGLDPEKLFAQNTSTPPSATTSL